MRPAAQATACREYTDFRALRASVDWGALAGSTGSLFESPEWFENLALTCPVQDAVTLLLHMSSAEGITVLPLRQRHDGKVESLSNYYAPVFGPACTSTAAAVAHAKGLAQSLASRRASRLQLHPLDPTAPFWQAFTQALQREGYWVDRYFTFGNWYHPCDGVNWAAYLGSRPSRLRHTILRSRRKLQTDPRCTVRVLDASTPADEVSLAVADFERVYARSWKRPEPHPLFIPSFCRMAHAQGWLRVGLCHLDGEPVAAQLWLVRGGVASIFKLAYDQRHAKLGAGTVVSAALSEHALDIDHVREIDFLAGDDPYKREWMACRREREGIIAFHPGTLRGLASAALHYGGRLVRRGTAWGKKDGPDSRRTAPNHH